MVVPDWSNPWDILPFFQIKDVDESKTVDVNANDSLLSFSLLGGVYLFWLNIEVGAGTAIKCGLTGPAFFQVFHGQCLRKDSGTGNLVHEIAKGAGTPTVTNISAASAFCWWGWFLVGDEGDVHFVWSRNTASGTSTITARSNFALMRVG